MSMTTFTPMGAMMMDPYVEMRRMSEEMNRMINIMNKPGEMSGMEMMAFPKMDVKEDDKNIKIMCDLPGMNKEDIKIEMKNGMLCISGERSTEKKTENEMCYRMERHYGKFYRTMPIPQGITEQMINAKLDKGVLEIMIPKPAQQMTQEGKKIMIK